MAYLFTTETSTWSTPLATSTLSYWGKAHKVGKLGDIGKMKKPLTEIKRKIKH